MDLAEVARSLAGPFNDDYNQLHSCYQCHGSPLGKVYVNTPWPAVCFDVDNEVMYLKQDLRISNKGWQSGVVNDPVFDSLTHYWSMDEASGTRMDSKGSVNLVEHLATLTAGSGIKNNGASWPLASGAYLEAAMDLRPTQSISIWFNKSPDGNDVVFDGALDSDLALEAGHTGVLRVGTGGDGWVDSTLFSLEQWHNVVLVITPNGPDASLAWYLDGALVNSGVALTGQASGGIIDFGGCYGTLDEIAVWNIALNQANVTTLWNGGIGKFYRP